MLPILFSLGPVKIYSYGVLLVLGLFLGLYFWWKMGRDEHFDEIALFDGFFLSLLVYFVAGRAGYVITHLSEVGTLYRSLAILAYPGISEVVGIVAVIAFMILFARSHDWDSWKVLDSASVTMASIFIFGGIGGLLNGTNPGHPAKFGLIYPGDTVARIPVDIWIIVWSLITFAIVSRVRKNFRFYAWYKGESSTAQEGLASLIFAGLVGLYYLVVGWIREPIAKVGAVPAEFLAGLALLLFAGYVIYHRVGRRDGSSWSKLKSIIRRK
jgi:phosphatidylglycerol:prolipoprotein diacylglycerol transferase